MRLRPTRSSRLRTFDNDHHNRYNLDVSSDNNYVDYIIQLDDFYKFYDVLGFNNYDPDNFDRNYFDCYYDDREHFNSDKHYNDNVFYFVFHNDVFNINVDNDCKYHNDCCNYFFCRPDNYGSDDNRSYDYGFNHFHPVDNNICGDDDYIAGHHFCSDDHRSNHHGNHHVTVDDDDLALDNYDLSIDNDHFKNYNYDFESDLDDFYCRSLPTRSEQKRAGFLRLRHA